MLNCLDTIATRGSMVEDVQWSQGFFLKTFPDKFICAIDETGN